MASEHTLIAEVETAGYRCWPARELEVYDGWELRYADGFSRRGNSLLPVAGSDVDLETKLDRCRDWFGRRGLPLVVRLTPVCEPAVDAELSRRGFSREGQTHVMVSDLDHTAMAGEPMPSPKPDERWWRTMSRLWDIPVARQPGWKGIIRRIDLPAAFALVSDGDDDVACGLGVVDGSWLGLFEIVVAAEERRHGHGRRLTRSLLAWGAAQGARHAFLQVVAGNRPAVSLYESLGFRHLYDYWYRRAPQS